MKDPRAPVYAGRKSRQGVGPCLLSQRFCRPLPHRAEKRNMEPCAVRAFPFFRMGQWLTTPAGYDPAVFAVTGRWIIRFSYRVRAGAEGVGPSRSGSKPGARPPCFAPKKRAVRDGQPGYTGYRRIIVGNGEGSNRMKDPRRKHSRHLVCLLTVPAVCSEDFS